MNSLIFTTKDYETILKKFFHEEKFQSIIFESAKISPFSSKTVGYFGQHNRLEIKVKNNNIDQVLTFFAKTTANNNVRAKIAEKPFKKEIDAFEILMPLLQESSYSQWSPKCYLNKMNVIVLEDLSLKGYRSPRRGYFDLDHIFKAVEALASFHSASVIVEGRYSLQGKLGDQYENCLFEVSYTLGNELESNKWLYWGIRMIVHIMKLSKIYTKEEIKLASNRLAGFVLKVCDQFNNAETDLKVVSHGDLWPNNTMFNYSEQGRPINCIIVDYQLIRYGPAILDLASLIYINTDRKTRDTYLDEILTKYCEKFNENISLAGGINEEKQLPLKKCLKDFQYFSGSALFEAILYSTTTNMPEEIVEKVIKSDDGYKKFYMGDKSDLISEAFDIDQYYGDKLKNLVEELVRNYILTD